MELNTNNPEPIRRGNFDWSYHFSKTHSSSSMPEYVRHNIDVFNEVDGLDAVYQNGLRHYHGNLSTPSIEYELSEAGGTDKILVTINKLTAVKIGALNDDEVEILINDLGYDKLKTKADILSLHAVLMENNAAVSEYAEKAEAKVLKSIDENIIKEGDEDYEA
jgi:hypothetical protein